ncbi:hypothetical protein J2W52_001612 [Rhizobium miluonense]|uniref:Uncharacterized protein n=1 Tax=Rhizobium miluonense TaxID=411945 RepID=A0ABU1SNS5_9HYPH|nr:hypothetical protein [Rhizobium miluonense]
MALFDYATLAVAKHGELAWSNSRHKIRDITFLNMSLEAAYERFFGDQARSPTATRTATLLCSPLRASRCWRRNAMQLG